MTTIRTKAKEPGQPVEAVQWDGSNVAAVAAIMGFEPDVRGELLRIGLMDYVGPGVWVVRGVPNPGPMDIRWSVVMPATFARDWEVAE